MHRKTFPHWLVVQALAGCLIAACVAAPAAHAAEVTPAADPAAVLQGALRQLASGQPEAAAEALESLIAADPPTLDRKTACTAAGQALSQLGNHPAAARYFVLAVRAAESENAGAANNETTVLRIAAAGAALRSRQLDIAIEHSRAVIDAPAGEPSAAPTAEHLAMACRIAIAALADADRLPEAVALLQQIDARIEPAALADSAEQLAARCLSRNLPVEAMAAYRWHIEHLPTSPSRDRAELGVAWSAALGAEPPEQAAERLEGFADAYPEHADAPRAMRAAAACWSRADQHDAADRVQRLIIESWPRSAAAVTAVDELSDPARDDRSDHVCQARRDFVLQPVIDAPLGAAAIAAAVRDAAVAEDAAYWSAVSQLAIEHARSGPCVADALQRLIAADRAADAERLAVDVLGRLGQTGPSPEAVEAALRWAADARRWTLVALAAEQLDPVATAESGLSPAAAAMIAESLVQTSRGKLAQAWLDVAVERLQARSFPTLIRRAELSVAFDPLDVAEKRITAAAETADAPDQQALLEMLRAEISIRRARLDEARETLERLVRSDQTAVELRCRAQWLIGETFLLQARPADAVEAYRRVESMDPSGHWTAAALVQAGRAFEQLGRQRDATLCYSTLVQRFGDSPHAATAHDRLATIRDQPKRR